jgi:hypothetical protein
VTNEPKEISERLRLPFYAIDQHGTLNKVEAAYRRGDLFERLRRLMNAWATFCTTPGEAGKVIHMRGNGLAPFFPASRTVEDAK